MKFLGIEEIESNYIDNRNKSLWDEMSSRYKLAVVKANCKSYELKYEEGNDHVVILVTDEILKGIFTHELLHLKLRSYNLNAFLHYESLKNLKSSYIVSSIVNLLNNIEHILFLDEFIDLGFNESEFTMDYHTSKYTDQNFKSLTIAKKSGDEILYKVYFLSMQMTMMSEEYYGLNRDIHLNRMKCFDTNLFNEGILFYNDIIDFEINTNINNDNQERFDLIILKYLPCLEEVEKSALPTSY